jgi:hypothetical protein
MRRTIAVIMLGLVAICAPAATQKKKTKQPASPPPAVTIPKDAIPSPDGLSFSYTDKQGKKWTYRKTPFGIMKTPDTGAPAETPAADLSGTKAIDKGDTVRFERPGPFGVMSWEKKKTELTDDEQHILDGQNAKTQ